ncbi:MAG: PEP-CTERM sorting domain-containing protein [Pirellulales bacterium]
MKHAFVVLSGLFLLAAGPRAGHGAVTIVAKEISGNVVFAGSGTINLAGFTTFRTVSLLSGVYPVNTPYPPGVTLGGNSTGAIPADAYGGFPTGPSTFGFGDFRVADLVNGDRFGAGNNISTREIYVPSQYQSGVMLSGSSTYVSETFSSLGIVPGTYVWAWGSGANADSLTLNIIRIPEPSSGLLLFAGFAAMLIQRWK